MMHTVSTYLIGAFAIIITFGLAVFVHEFGHMMFALLRGVGVESFAIGMGPRIYSWKWAGIDFSFRWLPVGGFVKLKGMAPEEEKPADEPKEGEAKSEDDKTLADSSYDDLYALRNKGLVTKLMVFGGGVFMNYIAAIVGTVIILVMPSDMPLTPTKIDRVVPGSLAANAGLQNGDVIVAVNNHPTTTTQQVFSQIGDALKIDKNRSAVKRYFGSNKDVKPVNLNLSVRRGDNQLTVTVSNVSPITLDTTETMGIAFWIPPVVGEVSPYLPADKAGVKPGDRVLAINGQPIDSYNDLTEKILASPGQNVALKIDRKGQVVEVNVTPTENPKVPGRGLIGIYNQPPATVKVPGISVIDAVILAPVITTERIGDLAMVQYNFFKRATLRQVQENLGGPIMIAAMTARQASLGLKDSIDWFVMLNLVLLIFNVLPLPVLDGGFLLLSVIEAVIRRPVSPKILAPIYTVFTIFFIGLMLLITILDVTRFIK